MQISQHAPSASAATVGRHGEEARRYVRQAQAFRVHAAVFAVSMIGIVLVNLAINLAAGLAGQWWAWWSVPALIGWGLGVGVHGIAVRIARPRLSGVSREDERIDALLAPRQG